MKVSFGSNFDLVNFIAAPDTDMFTIAGEISLVYFNFATFGVSAYMITTSHGLCCIGKTVKDSFAIINRSGENIKVNYIAAGRVGSIGIESSSSETLQIGSVNEVILLFW